ncbi:MAG: BrnA antitoxin family protein [Pseudomonadota bacterium]
MDRKLTKRECEHHYYMTDAMRRFEFDMHHEIDIHHRIPNEWHDIAARRESAKKKICLAIDEDVLKWFKSMGPGYQPRINDILRAFMHAKLAGLLKGDETLDPFKERPAERVRPEWGSTAARFGEG